MTTATYTAIHDTACSSELAHTPPSNKHLPIAARQPAEVVREYGPFGAATAIHGVTHDGQRVWAATGEQLVGFEPASGATTHTLNVVCDAGTAFDGTHLYQMPNRASTRSTPPQARCWPPSPRRAAVMIPA